jgi:hypothetical protein
VARGAEAVGALLGWPRARPEVKRCRRAYILPRLATLRMNFALREKSTEKKVGGDVLK